MVVHILTIVTIVILTILFVAPAHILSMLRHHVEKLELVTRIVLEFNIDDALLVKNELNCLRSHSYATENHGAWHLAINDLASLVDEETWAMCVNKVLDT